MKEEEMFLNDLNDGRLVFFAGSGISFYSNIPRADEILSKTAEVFLPNSQSDQIDSELKRKLSADTIHEKIINKIQPEILYEQLLFLNENNISSLNLWKSLSPSYWHIQQKPTLTHFAIVSYSIKHRVPILTTNFDVLFEIALNTLKEVDSDRFGKVELDLIIPTNSGYPGLNRPIEPATLRLVKLHGTIGDNEENMFNTISTTLTSITVMKHDFIEYLDKLMTDKYLVIVGYSGSDLDIFPFIRELLRDKDSRIYWISKFKDSKTRDAALSLEENKRILIKGKYPEDFFKENYDNYISQLLGKQISQFLLTNKYKEESEKEKNELLDKHKTSLKELFKWPIGKKLLFAAILYGSVGSYEDAWEILKLTYDKYSSGLTRYEKCILLTELCSASHNNSKFHDLETYSKLLLKTAKKENLPEFEILGLINLAEYERMCIPFDTFLFEDEASVTYSGHLLETLESTIRKEIKIADLISTNHLGKGLIIEPKKCRNEILGILLSQSLIEFEIRKQAIKQSILKHFWKDGTNREIMNYLKKKWIKIENSSWKIGYALGIVNSYKFLTRIPFQFDKLGIMLSEGERHAALLSSKTALQLLQRNRIEIDIPKIKKRKELKDEYIKKLEDLYNESLYSGNIMNGIKALLGICEIDRITNSKIRDRKIEGRPIINILDELINRLDLPLWKKFWEKAKVKLQLDKNN